MAEKKEAEARLEAMETDVPARPADEEVVWLKEQLAAREAELVECYRASLAQHPLNQAPIND